MSVFTWTGATAAGAVVVLQQVVQGSESHGKPARCTGFRDSWRAMAHHGTFLHHRRTEAAGRTRRSPSSVTAPAVIPSSSFDDNQLSPLMAELSSLRNRPPGSTHRRIDALRRDLTVDAPGDGGQECRRIRVQKGFSPGKSRLGGAVGEVFEHPHRLQRQTHPHRAR